LEERVKQGERLGKDSPLLGFDPRGVKKNKFLRTTLVTRDIREAIPKAGFKWRPYVLRAYCDTNMIIAESKGKISHPYNCARIKAILRRGTAIIRVFCRLT
jgi:hypothetical protein